MPSLRNVAPKAAARTLVKTPNKKTRKRYQVPAVQRAFSILDTLNQSSFGLTVQEVSRAHRIPYSTAFYLLETMLDCGYVERHEDNKKYSLGYKLFAFRDASAIRNSLNLRAQAFPSLEELTEITRLTGHLAILEKNEAVYIEKSEPKGFIRLNTWVGERKLLHCTGVGKAILSTLPDPDVRALLGRTGMPPRTEHTITSPDVMVAALGAVRKQGYAVDDGEQELGVRCVAVPIRGLPFRAALSVSGPSSRVTVEQVPLIAPDIQAAANRVRLAFHAMA